MNISILVSKLNIFQFVSLKSVIIFGIILNLSLLSLLYIQFIAASKSGFVVRNYEQKIAGFQQENREKEINFVNSGSLSKIEKIALENGFERMNNLAYIEVMESSLALLEK